MANDRMNQGSSQGQQGSGDKPSYDKNDPKWDKSKTGSQTGQGTQTDMNRGSQPGQTGQGSYGQTGQTGQGSSTSDMNRGPQTGHPGQGTDGSDTGQGSQSSDWDKKNQSGAQTGEDKSGSSNR